MNWYVIRWLLLYMIVLVGMTIGSITFFTAIIEEAPVKCFDGVFMEQIQPDVPTTYVQRVWLCGIGMHYQFIEPDEDKILNRRNDDPVY